MKISERLPNKLICTLSKKHLGLWLTCRTIRMGTLHQVLSSNQSLHLVSSNYKLTCGAPRVEGIANVFVEMDSNSQNFYGICYYLYLCYMPYYSSIPKWILQLLHSVPHTHFTRTSLFMIARIVNIPSPIRCSCHCLLAQYTSLVSQLTMVH